jgi:GDP-L-fucose synthase
MVVSAIMRQLLKHDHAPDSIIKRTHAELNLTKHAGARTFCAAETPEQVYLAAANVGSIHAIIAAPTDYHPAK